MADVDVIIKIPEEEYEIIKAQNGPKTWAEYLIKNGTPLPKGHGRIGDLSKIYVELNEAQIEGTEEYKGLGKAKQIICGASTIIEADKESEK